MTQIEWQQLEATVEKMTAAEKRRLADLLEKRASGPAKQSIIGLFADEPELIEEIVQGIYEARESRPFRTGEAE
jgi:hypothetical protein